ncbi:TPA: hypothetical protein ON189_004997, partial [Serratia marcescens]|nr:hypothetical protein [Serratia marcescens]
TAQLSGTVAGTYTVVPQNNGAAIGSLSGTVTLTADTAPDGTHSTVSTDKSSITADGQDSMTLTFVAKDANDNPIPGIADDITFRVVDGNGNPAPAGAVTVSPATEIAPPGTYTATLTGEKADSYTVIPQYNGNAVGNLEVPVELKAGETPDGTQSTFAAPSPQSITADGTSTSTLSVTAKDANGNLINDLTGVTFAVTDGSGNPVTSGVTVGSTTHVGNGV